MNYDKFKEALANYPSLIFLIIANFATLIFALFYNLSTLQILLLYWFESVIIGFFNILKMLVVDWDKKFNKLLILISKIFMIPFFTFHYGLFMAAHFIFIILLSSINSMSNTLPWNAIFPILKSALLIIAIPVLLIFISHTFSFINNFMLNNEYTKTNIGEIMGLPYSRVFVMQFVLVFGAWISLFITAYFKNASFQTGFIVLFIILKTYTDIKSHVKERTKYDIINLSSKNNMVQKNIFKYFKNINK